jgi:YjbR
MAVKLEDARRFALALPDTTEEPHHNYGSFRVRGKIFVTIPPGGELLHIFLPEQQRELALAMDPEFLEPVHWGNKVLGVRAKLPLAPKATVLRLIEQAYAFKAEKAPPGSRSSRPRQPVRRPKNAA